MEAYEARMRDLEESKAKREAQLESELRTLQQSKETLLQEFDVALLELKRERKDTLWNILKAELEFALLKKAIFETRLNGKHLDDSLMQALAISKVNVSQNCFTLPCLRIKRTTFRRVWII